MWGQVIFSRGRASRFLPLPHGPRHAREEKAGPQGRSPELPLNFHATRPDTSALKEQSPNGASDLLGGVAGSAARGVGSREQPLRSAPSESWAPRPSPPGAEHATPRLPRRPLLPPHASPLSARRSWICVGRARRDSPLWRSRQRRL